MNTPKPTAEEALKALDALERLARQDECCWASVAQNAGIARRYIESTRQPEPARRLSPDVPEGWKLVPINPTEHMRQKGKTEFSEWGLRQAEAAYRAMLAAAPEPSK